MSKNPGEVKKPVTQERIFHIMVTLTFIVAGVFFIKNAMSKSIQAMIVIGVCLLVFSIISYTMHRLKIRQYIKQFVMCVCLVILVFVISANSGSYYSDDFPLFLAIIGLSGLYLEPRYTQIQAVLITIALIVLYVMHPEKADPLSQYIMCIALMDVAAFTFYLTIKRGRGFIGVSNAKAEEASQLLESIKTTSEELKKNHERSSRRLEGMKEVNGRLTRNTEELLHGSSGIQRGTQELERSFSSAHASIRATGSKIEGLDQDLKHVEVALSENNSYLRQMSKQVERVSSTVQAANEVFSQLQKQMQHISSLTDQLGNIAFNTTILALNASVEASRAGKYGAGFTVVANEVQKLATESDACSNQVSEVVADMKKQIALTARQMADSSQVIQASQETMKGMEQEFQNLLSQFSGLYQNIAEQNENVLQVDTQFDKLEHKVMEMEGYARTNQESVESIVAAIKNYQQHMELIVGDSDQLRVLSSAMLDRAEQNRVR